jgi:uncharacterized protein (TIGR02147 family)
MRSRDLFTFRSYKSYLAERLAHTKPTRGARARLAEAMGSQPAYVSSVLNGNGHFTPEQGEAINQFFSHSEAESDYFLLLLQWERAGTAGLKARLSRQMEKLREEKFNLKSRLPAAAELSEAAQQIYYSEWYYAAIHTIVSIPAVASLDSIAGVLKLEKKLVREVLKFLVEQGLVVVSKECYRIGPSRIHLGGTSPFVNRHHANWRLKALRAMGERKGEGLHYSSVVTLSESDAIRIQEKLVDEIKGIKEIIRASPEETLMGFNLDFFRL